MGEWLASVAGGVVSGVLTGALLAGATLLIRRRRERPRVRTVFTSDRTPPPSPGGEVGGPPVPVPAPRRSRGLVLVMGAAAVVVLALAVAAAAADSLQPYAAGVLAVASAATTFVVLLRRVDTA